MEFALVFVNLKVPRGEPVTFEEMGRYAGELAREGKIRGGAPLQPEEAGARVSLRGGQAAVTDGPFAESKEFVGGFMIVDVASRAEAIEVAKRCPATRSGIVEVRALPDRDAEGTAPGTSPRFMFLLYGEPGLTDPDGSKYQSMLAYDRTLKGEGCYVESSQLGQEPPAARVELLGGRAVVTDGPFAETKEVAGGYYVVEARSLADAIAVAKRCPAAHWGTIEVREVIKVPPPSA
ncbi:MAG TPA: YciI family protein [Myxococcota bacterium]|jgi:hypothetical protein|nr:YciI family protein [Myxococcota bacterium]